MKLVYLQAYFMQIDGTLNKLTTVCHLVSLDILRYQSEFLISNCGTIVTWTLLEVLNTRVAHLTIG